MGVWEIFIKCRVDFLDFIEKKVVAGVWSVYIAWEFVIHFYRVFFKWIVN